jgi:four helix bundle protein
MKLENLDVFRLGHELTLQVYALTTLFPHGERYGLVSQMRRSAVSICSNISEGYHRESKNEFRHFLSIARGSTGELCYQLLLSKDLGYIDEEKFNELKEKGDRVSRMLTKLSASLVATPDTAPDTARRTSNVARSTSDAARSTSDAARLPPHAARSTPHDT